MNQPFRPPPVTICLQKIAVVCTALAVTACASGDGHSDAGAQQGVSEEQTGRSHDNVLFEASIARAADLAKASPRLRQKFPGEWRDLGKIEFVDDPDAPVPRLVVEPASEDVSAESDSDENGVVLLSASAGRAFLVPARPALRGDLRASNKPLVARPTNERPPTELELQLDEVTPFGWSNGVDNRVKKGIADVEGGTPSTPAGYHANLRKIGYLSGGCTGTVVGSDPGNDAIFVLTAAHCVVNTSGNVVIRRLEPRRDNTTTPFGRWEMKSTSADVLVHPSYLSQNCFSTAPTIALSCVSHDIAVVRMEPDTASALDPGWFGHGAFAAEGSDNLSGNKYHRGYPGCSSSGAPSGCTAQTLWGDGVFTIGTWGATQDGWYRRAKISSDTSPGHSGGPIYVEWGGSTYVFGVVSAEDCSGSSCSATRPNWVRLIDGWYYSQMQSFIF